MRSLCHRILSGQARPEFRLLFVHSFGGVTQIDRVHLNQAVSGTLYIRDKHKGERRGERQDGLRRRRQSVCAKSNEEIASRCGQNERVSMCGRDRTPRGSWPLLACGHRPKPPLAPLPTAGSASRRTTQADGRTARAPAQPLCPGRTGGLRWTIPICQLNGAGSCAHRVPGKSPPTATDADCYIFWRCGGMS
jgi:hypothetical protein